MGIPLTEKLQKLIRLAGIGSIDFDNKFVAIKMHFGELGNLAYLRPNYAKAVADVVKANGGMPFLTDCNTLYPGSRKHALEHMDCANMNGFNTVTTGCQIIIGDGLRGTDDILVPVPNGEYCKEAYIGRAIMDADIFIRRNDQEYRNGLRKPRGQDAAAPERSSACYRRSVPWLQKVLQRVRFGCDQL